MSESELQEFNEGTISFGVETTEEDIDHVLYG